MKRIVVASGTVAADQVFAVRLAKALRAAGCEVQQCGIEDVEIQLEALAQGSVPVVINRG